MTVLTPPAALSEAPFARPDSLWARLWAPRRPQRSLRVPILTSFWRLCHTFVGPAARMAPRLAPGAQIRSQKIRNVSKSAKIEVRGSPCTPAYWQWCRQPKDMPGSTDAWHCQGPINNKLPQGLTLCQGQVCAGADHTRALAYQADEICAWLHFGLRSCSPAIKSARSYGLQEHLKMPPGLSGRTAWRTQAHIPSSYPSS